VYEHRSRLEKSLQKEKNEHKKSKEDLQTSFAKEKQESQNRFNSLNTQHKMLKSEHEDVQNELSAWQHKHAKLDEDFKQLQSDRELEFKQLKEDKVQYMSNLQAQIDSLQDEASRLRAIHTGLTDQLRESQLIANDSLNNNQMLSKLKEDLVINLKDVEDERQTLLDRIRELERQVSTNKEQDALFQNQMAELHDTAAQHK
uniref:Golgi integral membrane protein 4-like n=1 Tax=Saccoglossus kowalevskii TaxID=10224 RepID=A0ABM0MB25_SACKO